jgi:hypothetical protein
METVKRLKEKKRQTCLKNNQINVSLIKKLDKLPNGEIVIAIYVGKNSKLVTNEKQYKIKSVFTHNQFISFIEI